MPLDAFIETAPYVVMFHFVYLFILIFFFFKILDHGVQSEAKRKNSTLIAFGFLIICFILAHILAEFRPGFEYDKTPKDWQNAYLFINTSITLESLLLFFELLFLIIYWPVGWRHLVFEQEGWFAALKALSAKEPKKDPPTPKSKQDEYQEFLAEQRLTAAQRTAELSEKDHARRLLEADNALLVAQRALDQAGTLQEKKDAKETLEDKLKKYIDSQRLLIEAAADRARAIHKAKQDIRQNHPGTEGESLIRELDRELARHANAKL